MSYSGSIKSINVECGYSVPQDVDSQSWLKIQILNVLRHKDSKWIVFLISCNSVVIYYLWNWSISTHSLALKAYSNSVEFNVCALAVCLISIWVEQRTLRRADKLGKCRSSGEPTCSIAVLGLEKYEVFALLVSSCLSLIAGLLVAVDACARIRDQPVVHEGRLGLGAVLGLVTHLVTVWAYPDAGLNHVVCKALPCPTFKGINPILGGNLIGFAILCGAHTAIHFWELYIVDTAAAFGVVSLTVASMLPLAFFAASIVLQKLSHHMNEQLDKCLREALIIDGVLEFRNERFWTKSFGKLAGSLEVRIRKNADESYVLKKVMKRLSQVVSTLSVQEFREPSSGYAALSGSAVRLPVEYYMDELLPVRAKKSTDAERAEEDKVPEKSVSISEILNCGSSPYEGEDRVPKLSVKIEDLLGCGSSSYKFGSKRASLQPGYATLLLNSSPAKKTERNAILLGGRCDLEDLNCTAKLFRQTSLPADVPLGVPTKAK